jgi:hypothetical protein
VSKIYVPTLGVDSWQRLLADPEKHWRTGSSAKTLAHCWEQANGLPAEIAAMFAAFGTPELLLGLAEHKVPLPGSARGDSQNDIFALIRAADSTFAVTIEGKVNEPFDKPVHEWLKNASPGKIQRLQYICQMLGLTQPLPDHISYQLLHRTASAVIEARRFKTDYAAMIVHSFSPTHMWFDAFTRFTQLFGKNAEQGVLIETQGSTAPPLLVGWATGDSKFLSA